MAKPPAPATPPGNAPDDVQPCKCRRHHGKRVPLRALTDLGAILIGYAVERVVRVLR